MKRKHACIYSITISHNQNKSSNSGALHKNIYSIAQWRMVYGCGDDNFHRYMTMTYNRTSVWLIKWYFSIWNSKECSDDFFVMFRNDWKLTSWSWLTMSVKWKCVYAHNSLNCLNLRMFSWCMCDEQTYMLLFHMHWKIVGYIFLFITIYFIVL